MKKRLIFFATAIMSVFALIFILYFSSTMSPKECIEYCQENTKRNATSFVRFGDGRYTQDYAYWIATNGDSSKTQEIFIFRRKFLGPFHFDRYQFVVSSTQSANDSEETNVGSIQFFTRKDNGDKETGSTLLFYGALEDTDAYRYQYTLTQSGISETHQGKVLKTESAWILKIFDLGNIDENSAREITEVNFYDSNGNLIFKY